MVLFENTANFVALGQVVSSQLNFEHCCNWCVFRFVTFQALKYIFFNMGATDLLALCFTRYRKMLSFSIVLFLSTYLGIRKCLSEPLAQHGRMPFQQDILKDIALFCNLIAYVATDFFDFARPHAQSCKITRYLILFNSH